MAKATHIGTCQCCGNQQKLPNGVLSKHGYTVEHGWFEGTCYGSGHKPFEQSTDLIDYLIEVAGQKCDELRREIDRWENETEVVRRHDYIRGNYSRGERSRHVWNDVNVLTIADDEDRPRYVYEDRAEKLRHDSYLRINWDAEDKSRAAHVRYANSAWLNTLKGKLENTEQYINWQKHRVATWKPAELKPI
jgi:hypothetical protein